MASRAAGSSLGGDTKYRSIGLRSGHSAKISLLPLVQDVLSALGRSLLPVQATYLASGSQERLSIQLVELPFPLFAFLPNLRVRAWLIQSLTCFTVRPVATAKRSFSDNVGYGSSRCWIIQFCSRSTASCGSLEILCILFSVPILDDP